MPSKNRKPRQTSEYHKNRRTLLADKPRCHWCKRRQATEADHVIEIDRGGNNTLENLVPSCKQCNGRRGANYKAAKQRAKMAARPGASNASKPNRKPKRTQKFLDEHQQLPAIPIEAVSVICPGFRIPVATESDLNCLQAFLRSWA